MTEFFSSGEMKNDILKSLVEHVLSVNQFPFDFEIDIADLAI